MLHIGRSLTDARMCSPVRICRFVRVVAVLVPRSEAFIIYDWFGTCATPIHLRRFPLTARVLHMRRFWCWIPTGQDTVVVRIVSDEPYAAAVLAVSIVEVLYKALGRSDTACSMQLKTCRDHIRLENCSPCSRPRNSKSYPNV